MTADVSRPPVPSVFAERRSPRSWPPEGSVASRPRVGVRALLAIALPAVYAWGATVAVPVLSAKAPTSARWVACAALLSLVAGLAVSRRSSTVGRGVGVMGFLGLCVVAWALLGSAVDVANFDPVRAGLGSLAWGLFALGWGAPARRGPALENDPSSLATPILLPREGASRSFGVAFALVVGCALGLPLLAFRVAQPGVALFAHAVALAAAISVITVGSRVLVLRVEAGSAARQPRGMLWACGVWLLGGLLWLLWSSFQGVWPW